MVHRQVPEPLQRFNASTVKRLAARSAVRPLFRRSLPCGCVPRVPPGERILFHRRSSRSWLRRLPHSPPFPPYRPSSPLLLSLSAENPPCTRSPDKFLSVLFTDRSL